MLRDISRNPWAQIDVYSLSHQVLKECADWEVSHLYNRGKGEEGCEDGMIFYGFKENIEEFLTTPLEHWMVDELKVAAEGMGIGEIFERGLEKILRRIVDELEGFAPLEIQTVPEGSWIPAGTPFAQVRNTVEGFGEIVTLPEAIFLHNHFASGCATRAFHMKNYLVKKQKEYGYDDSFIGRFHSFGFRAHNSRQGAYWAGTAWALFLTGTDDFHIKVHLKDANLTSIPALAHKVTQQWDKEMDCFLNAIDEAYKTKLKVVALVIDTYNADRVINDYLTTLAAYARTKGVHIVLRPDSGDVLGQAVNIYKNVKRLNLTNVSVIIGEGMSFQAAIKADQFFESEGVPLNFISYGIGAGFYKDIDRDYLGFAMKTSYSNGKPRMKFAMTPIKRSIPHIVVLNKNDVGNLVVSFEKERHEESFYETIYYHDKNIVNSFIDIVDEEDWYKIQKLANKQIPYQEQILLAPEVHDLIAELKVFYRA